MAAITSDPAAGTAAQPLSAVELEQARLCLRQAQDAIVGATKGVSDAQAGFKPDPHTWSIAENVEHVVMVQERVLGPMWLQLATAPPCPEDRDCGAVDAFIMDRFPSRLKKFSGPEVLHPTGALPLAEAIGRVAVNTGRFTELLAATDLRQHALEAMPLKAVSDGRYHYMDGYQWILAQAAHTERHAKQILEVKAHPNFPAS